MIIMFWYPISTAKFLDQIFLQHYLFYASTNNIMIQMEYKQLSKQTTFIKNLF